MIDKDPNRPYPIYISIVIKYPKATEDDEYFFIYKVFKEASTVGWQMNASEKIPIVSITLLKLSGNSYTFCHGMLD